MELATSTTRILVVEDDPGYGPLMMRMLDSQERPAKLARSGEEACELAGGERFDVAICDLNLPGLGGLELIERLRGTLPEIAIVVASGISDSDTAGLATELGASGYLVKPFDQDQLRITVDTALRHRRAELAGRRRSEDLELTVAERTRELERAVAEITLSRQETIARLMRALEMRDGDTGAHVERMGALAEAFAGWAGIGPERAETIGLAARMHDIGKIGVPDYVLLKPGPLDAWERREIERHPEIGREILDGSHSELLRTATTIAVSHHEWWDGSGYPAGLAGEQIPLEGRIAAIVDVFDALHSERCYRPALPPVDAFKALMEERGTHFDPGLLDVFVSNYPEAMRILHRHSGEGDA